MIANYLPLQDAYGGPNYFTLDPEALYQIHLDNNGDAREDLTFTFQFSNDLANGGKGLAVPAGDKMTAVPLRNIGVVSAADTSALNEAETYTLKVTKGNRYFGQSASVTNADTGSKTFKKPLDYIGTKSFGAAPAYANYARAHLYNINIPECSVPGRMFVGPAQGAVRGQPGHHLRPGERARGGRRRRQHRRRPEPGAQHDRRQEHHHLRAGAAQGLHPRQGRSGKPRDVVGRLDHGQRAPGVDPQRLQADAQVAGAEGRAVRPGLAPRHAAGQRGGDRPARQEPLQRQRAQGRRPVRRLRHQPQPARAARDPVRRGGRRRAQPVPARRPGGGVPDRRRRASTPTARPPR